MMNNSRTPQKVRASPGAISRATSYSSPQMRVQMSLPLSKEFAAFWSIHVAVYHIRRLVLDILFLLARHSHLWSSASSLHLSRSTRIIPMQVVGAHLAEVALSIQGRTPDDDLYARSAFNRYYYASFLASRKLIAETMGTKNLPHAAIPAHLKGEFRKTFRRQIQSRFKSGALSVSHHSRMLTDLSQNTQLLGKLLEDAYSVRVLADYEPDVPVEIKDNTFRLGISTLASAGHWAGTTEMYCRNLRQIWKDLGH
jgi:hypothetical protein